VWLRTTEKDGGCNNKIGTTGRKTIDINQGSHLAKFKRRARREVQMVKHSAEPSSAETGAKPRNAQAVMARNPRTVVG